MRGLVPLNKTNSDVIGVDNQCRTSVLDQCRAFKCLALLCIAGKSKSTLSHVKVAIKIHQAISGDDTYAGLIPSPLNEQVDEFVSNIEV